jgi:hypothetical protein
MTDKLCWAGDLDGFIASGLCWLPSPPAGGAGAGCPAVAPAMYLSP